jgi:hypothetical protein
MTLLTWVCLGFLVVAVVGAGANLFLRGRLAWRAFRSFSGATFEALGDVERRVARAEAHASGAAAGAEELNAANARLQRSLVELATLREAAGEARNLVAGLRGAVPRK